MCIKMLTTDYRLGGIMAERPNQITEVFLSSVSFHQIHLTQIDCTVYPTHKLYHLIDLALCGCVPHDTTHTHTKMYKICVSKREVF